MALRDGAIVLTFLTMQRALDWYRGEEYAAIRTIREGAARARMYVSTAWTDAKPGHRSASQSITLRGGRTHRSVPLKRAVSGRVTRLRSASRAHFGQPQVRPVRRSGCNPKCG